MKAYLDLLAEIMDRGVLVQTGATLESESRKPKAKSLFAAQFRHDLAVGFPAVTTKRLFFDSVVKEVLWFLRGETSVKTLGCKIWDSWAGKNGHPEGECGPIYGAIWRRWPYSVNNRDEPEWESPSYNNYTDGAGMRTFDQIGQIVKGLKAVVADPGDRARRRLVLSGWNPPLVDQQGLPPCHTAAQWLPINGRLNCHCFWRSIDTPVGMPFNIAQYALLTHVLAAVSGLEPGELAASVTDLHIYDNQYDMIREQLSREPYAHPKLRLPNLVELAPDLTINQVAALTPDMFGLDGYECWPPLKCEVAV